MTEPKTTGSGPRTSLNVSVISPSDSEHSSVPGKRGKDVALTIQLPTAPVNVPGDDDDDDIFPFSPHQTPKEQMDPPDPMSMRYELEPKPRDSTMK